LAITNPPCSAVSLQ